MLSKMLSYYNAEQYLSNTHVWVFYPWI